MSVINKISQEDITNCRENLSDLIALLQRLGPICDSFSELISMCELALVNDGQCKLLLKTIAEQAKHDAPVQADRRR